MFKKSLSFDGCASFHSPFSVHARVATKWRCTCTCMCGTCTCKIFRAACFMCAHHTRTCTCTCTCMCGTCKIFRAAGFMCAHHTRTCTCTPTHLCRDNGIFFVVMLIQTTVILVTLNRGIISLKTLSENGILKFKPHWDALYLVMGLCCRVSAASHR